MRYALLPFGLALYAVAYVLILAGVAGVLIVHFTLKGKRQ